MSGIRTEFEPGSSGSPPALGGADRSDPELVTAGEVAWSEPSRWAEFDALPAIDAAVAFEWSPPPMREPAEPEPARVPEPPGVEAAGASDWGGPGGEVTAWSPPEPAYDTPDVAFEWSWPDEPAPSEPDRAFAWGEDWAA